MELTVVFWDRQKVVYWATKWYENTWQGWYSGETFLLVFTDRGSREGANALENALGSGKIDQLRFHRRLHWLTYSESVFDKRYLTGSYRGQDLNTSNEPTRSVTSERPTRNSEGSLPVKPIASEPTVHINDRGRRLSNKLDFLDTSQDYSRTKGSLELHTPSTKHEITTRRRQSTLRDPTPQSSQPQTRSKTALSKNLPYLR